MSSSMVLSKTAFWHPWHSAIQKKRVVAPDDSGVAFDAGFPRAAVWAWAGPMPFPDMRCGVFHGLPSVMTTARMPSEVLFV